METTRPIYIVSSKNIPNTTSLDLLEINYLDFDIDIENYDAFIFTSKNGVKSLYNSFGHFPKIDTFAISSKTASEIESLDGKVTFTGTKGDGDSFATELIPHLKNKKVLYLRGKKVVSNLSSILNLNDIICDETIVYETKCSEQTKNIQLQKNAIIIFSSPSTVECFFKQYSWHNTFTAIAIGKTTQKYIPSNIQSIVSSKPSIEYCVKLAKTI